MSVMVYRVGRMLLPALFALFAANEAWASGPTRTTIVLDGNMSDWNAVLLDPVNSQTDPQGSSAPSTDGDALIDARRDLLGFAYTWDATTLFLYARRASSGGGTMRVLVYIDIDNNGRMEATDWVAKIDWKPNSVATGLTPYQPAQPLGDFMVDGVGLADGHTLLGSLGGVTASFSGVQAANKVEVETGVSWASLGVAPGTAVSLHVATVRNNSIPSGIQDNMAGTGGGALSTQFEEVQIAPDQISNQSGGTTVVYVHQLSNTGNLLTVAEISSSWSCSGSPTVGYWEDVNANQFVDVGVDIPLSDSNGDTSVDYTLAFGDSVAVLVQVLLPAGTPTSGCDLTVQVIPRGLPTKISSVVDTNTYPGTLVTLLKGADKGAAAPGEVVTYTTTYTNTGVDSAFVVVVSDAVPTNTTYIIGSASGPGVSTSYSHNNGSSWDASELPPVTDVRWSVLLPLAVGANGAVSFQVRVD